MENNHSKRKIMPTLRQANKQETRRLLLQVGLELFMEKGYLNTRASEIAGRAGVAVGTLYLHFGDKEGLLRAILNDAAEALHTRVMQVYAQPPQDPYALARAHIEALVGYIEENPASARFLLAHASNSSLIHSDLVDKIVSQVSEDLRRGAAYGVYRADIDPDLAARAEVNLNLGLLGWWAEHRHQASREQIIDTLTKFRYSGLHVPK